MKERVIVVLGMHRSGTSILSAALECLGVGFGSHLLGPREDNPKGFWEDEEFVDLNERLYELGGSFSSALGFDSETVRKNPAYPALHERMKDLLRARLDKDPLFGLKDPRMPRLMELWGAVLDELGVDVALVLPSRNPLSVAASLAKRDEFPVSKSLLLWYEHMARGLLYAARRQILVVDYDAFMDQPREALLRIADQLGLGFDEERFDRFAQETWSGELRHSRFSDDDLQRHIDGFPALLNLHALLTRLSQDQIEGLSDQLQRVELAFKELWPVLRRCGLLDIELWGGAKHLRQLQVSFAARERELSSWVESLESSVRSLVQEQDRQLALCSARETELLSWIANLEGTVRAAEEQRRSDHDWFQEQMLGLQELASQREQSVRQLDEKLAQTWKALQQVRSSRSWRLTKPLRWCGRLLMRS